MYDTFLDKMHDVCDKNNKKFSIFRGPLILFEGIDLCGKSTVIKNFNYAFGHRLRVIDEPTKRAKLRDIIFNSENLFPEKHIFSDVKDIINYYLVMASRSYSLYIAFEELFRKNIVFLDRSFISTMVYQNSAFNTEFILSENIKLYEEISYKFDFIEPIRSPDLIFFLDINYETYVNRMKRLSVEKNSFDSLDKTEVLNRINMYRNCMDYMIKSDIVDSKIVFIDANADIPNVTSSIASVMSKYLSGLILD